IPVLSTELLRDLGASFHGDILVPGTDAYDAARKVWNGMIDRRPACIARCKSVGDVQAALRFARENDLEVAVRGGGHNAAGLAVCDGGLVIDLGGMRDVVVDAKQRIARAGGGATWGDFDRATAEHGLATTGGAVSTTGIAGLTLGGGLGWLMRSYGMACDNLVGAEVVTADGQVVRASATENADLFWGLRGGGGNFGIVTTFEYALHPVSTIFGGMLLYPLTSARDVLRVYREVTTSAPDALTVFAAMMHAPDGTPVIALVICYNGPANEGERAILKFRDFVTPIAGEVGPMPYTALQSMLDAGFPEGLQVHWRSEFVQSIPDALIDAAVSAFERVPSPLSALMFEQFGGAVKRVPRDATAFDQRDSDYNLVIVSRWQNPADAEPNVRWARETSEAARAFTNGRVYVNYIGAGEAPDRVRAAFGADKFDRLATIKRKYDPTNVFRLNQNIPPSDRETV
ncbi:MAG TPA: FAD-binding oxidoreductase, partial [Gemmatimonadaceae bacterium]|nr:FAD-binding oxidoreductase [Gemmatimonadaceae bacterium]